MNIDFHYYATYLIAACAGFAPDQSETIAHACAMVDDNNRIYHIGDYANYVSQTENILKPRMDLLRIYPLFHFIPGDYDAISAWRKDGKLHLMNVTAGSENAKKIISAAKNSGNLYAFGIACHSYADTFAHQNFVGYYEDFNAMAGVMENLTPNVGHADALTKPDEPGLTWIDPRLMNEERNNNKIFLAAAVDLFGIMGGEPDMLPVLLSDLSIMFDLSDSRKRAYFAKFLSQAQTYGGKAIADYHASDWLKQCSTRRLFRRIPKAHFRESHWYKFQEAVKWYQNTAWSILDKSVFAKMDLKRL